jgi:hypothetical protein
MYAMHADEQSPTVRGSSGDSASHASEQLSVVRSVPCSGSSMCEQEQLSAANSGASALTTFAFWQGICGLCLLSAWVQRAFSLD